MPKDVPARVCDPDFLFGAFLPYRDALHLARWVQGLLRLERALGRGGPVSEHFCWGAGGSARRLAPQIRPAEIGEEEFERMLRDEQEKASLSEDELEEKMEREAQELSDKIESGELDIWDDSPKWVDPKEASRFVRESVSYLTERIVPACNGDVSFVEGLVCEAVLSIRDGDARAQRALYSLLLVWDYARMFHEGEPPYKIAFSRQVAETLGIDPQMESIRMQEMRPVGAETARQLTAAKKIALVCMPERRAEIERVFGEIEFSQEAVGSTGIS